MEAIVDSVRDAMGSPWVYLALFLVAAIDAFFPVVPSESLVITGGVFAAAHGEPNVLAVMAVAAAGAMIGDHISYYFGRGAGGRVLSRMKPGTRRKAAFDWAGTALNERGGLVLIVARYIPGGRTAATLTMGAVGYSRRSFTAFDAAAGCSWAIYCTMVGYIGGAAFEDNPFKGLLLGFAIAMAFAVTVEVVRHIRTRRARAREAAAARSTVDLMRRA